MEQHPPPHTRACLVVLAAQRQAGHARQEALQPPLGVLVPVQGALLPRMLRQLIRLQLNVARQRRRLLLPLARLLLLPGRSVLLLLLLLLLLPLLLTSSRLLLLALPLLLLPLLLLLLLLPSWRLLPLLRWRQLPGSCRVEAVDLGADQEAVLGQPAAHQGAVL